MVQIRRPRGDGDPGERGEVERGLHPVLHVVRARARVVIPAARHRGHSLN